MEHIEEPLLCKIIRRAVPSHSLIISSTCFRHLSLS